MLKDFTLSPAHAARSKTQALGLRFAHSDMQIIAPVLKLAELGGFGVSFFLMSAPMCSQSSRQRRKLKQASSMKKPKRPLQERHALRRFANLLFNARLAALWPTSLGQNWLGTSWPSVTGPTALLKSHSVPCPVDAAARAETPMQ